MTTLDQPLTDAEIATLKALGWFSAGGEIEDGIIKCAFRTRDNQRVVRSRAEWRGIIAAMPPPTDDVAAFGVDAWVYCRQHMKAHQTGWCGVGNRDKVALGVTTAEEAEAKCREWGFELYADLFPNS